MLLKKIVIIGLLLFIEFSFANSQQKESDIGGPPKIEEMVGYWKKVNYPDEGGMNKVNPWPLKYQWFAITENGKFYSMMTSTDTTYTSSELKEIFDQFPEIMIPDYKYDGKFMRIDNKEIENYIEKWGVNLLKVDINEYIKKGCVIMSLDDGKGQPAYFRVLERIE